MIKERAYTDLLIIVVAPPKNIRVLEDPESNLRTTMKPAEIHCITTQTDDIEIID